LTPAGIGCCICSDGAMMTGTFSGDTSYGCGFLAHGSAGRCAVASVSCSCAP
jgi:hypothetical protein